MIGKFLRKISETIKDEEKNKKKSKEDDYHFDLYEDRRRPNGSIRLLDEPDDSFYAGIDD